MTVAPYLLGNRGPGRYVGSGGEGEGLEEQPIVTVAATGDVTINGKVKAGAFGKFVYPMATIAAGRQYTFRYDPDFSRLAQQGKLAMVGFGLKSGNDFHIVGLRGNGSTGLDKYKVYGTAPNGWNKQTGHTEVDGNAPVNGTQAGPNYIRLKTSADGATYVFQTSGDSGATWSTEFSGSVPTPFSSVTGIPTFGLALWFNNADAGPFSVLIEQFADADPLYSMLLHFDGTDTSVVFRDATGKAWTAFGQAQIDSAQAKWLTSGLFDGSGDYITTPSHVDFSPGANEFTLDCWARWNSLAAAGNQCIVCRDQIGGTRGWLLYTADGTAGTTNDAMSFVIFVGGTAYQIIDTTPVTTGAWFHFRAVRDQSGGQDNIRLYKNGVQTAGSPVAVTGSVGAPAEPCVVGALWGVGAVVGGSYLNGWVDELMMKKGVCLSPGGTSFTPPTLPYSDPFTDQVVYCGSASGIPEAPLSQSFALGSTPGLPVVVAYHSRGAIGSTQINSVTIDGQALTPGSGIHSVTANASQGSAIASGTALKSGTITIAMSTGDNATRAMWMDVFMVYGLSSLTPLDTVAAGASANNPTVNLDIDTGGVVFAGCCGASVNQPIAFTGIDKWAGCNLASFATMGIAITTATAAEANHAIQATSGSATEYLTAVSYK